LISKKKTNFRAILPSIKDPNISVILKPQN